MMEANQAKFEGWAVVELFGHSREVGFVTTEYFGPAAMFRIDVPKLEEREYELTLPEYIGSQLAPAGTKVKREALDGRTRFLGTGAVYALNPCTEEAARQALDRLHYRKVSIVSLPEGKQLVTALPGKPDYEDEGVEPEE